MSGAREDRISDKSRLVAALLCGFFGVFGIHRFYVGKIGTGILMLLTLGGLGVWSLIDLILILAGSFRDREGCRVLEWLESEERRPLADERVAALNARMDRIEQRLAEVQGVMIDLSEKFDRRR